MTKLKGDKITIITVTVGRESLKECLQSSHEQSYDNFEHIIMVDVKAGDAGMEAARRIAAPFSKARVLQQRHNGIFNGWNLCTPFITGELIMYLGDDDLILGKDTFLLIAAAAKKYPESKWFYGDYIINTTQMFIAEAWNYRRLLGYNFIGTCSTYFRREIIEKHQFDEDYLWASDYEFSMRIGKDHPARYIPALMSLFNWNDGSMSFDRRQAQIEETIAAQKKYTAMLDAQEEATK